MDCGKFQNNEANKSKLVLSNSSISTLSAGESDRSTSVSDHRAVVLPQPAEDGPRDWLRCYAYRSPSDSQTMPCECQQHPSGTRPQVPVPATSSGVHVSIVSAGVTGVSRPTRHGWHVSETSDRSPGWRYFTVSLEARSLEISVLNVTETGHKSVCMSRRQVLSLFVCQGASLYFSNLISGVSCFSFLLCVVATAGWSCYNIIII